MFSFLKRKPHHAISPQELDALLRKNDVLLIDVREPSEFKSGHIATAINLPLSRFAAAKVPASGGRKVVLQCATGKRSRLALLRCPAGGIDTHLSGGIAAWTKSGFPVVRG